MRWTKPKASEENFPRSDKTKIELFGHNDQRNTVPTVMHGGGRIMVRGCLAASGTAARHEVDGVVKNLRIL